MNTRSLALGLLGVTLLGGVASAEFKYVGFPTGGPGTFTRGYMINPSHTEGVPLAGAPFAAANTHIIFLNPCTNGCKVSPGNADDNRGATELSVLATKSATLSKYPHDSTQWGNLMNCVKTTFQPFNVTITDQDPGSAAHFEVIVTGSDGVSINPNLSQAGGVAAPSCGGVGQCDAYVPNTIVYDFANSWNQYPHPYLEDCATIAQEIAHTWALDHVVDASDPLTYNNYNSTNPRMYHNAEKCGSDCGTGGQPGYAPDFGTPRKCTGSDGTLGASFSTHICYGTAAATQDEITTITSLFGTGTPDTTKPTVMITSPTDGSSVTPGFQVRATLNDDQGISKAELRLDGTLVGTASAFPYMWTTPATLASGSHTIEVTAYDTSNNTAKASATVTYGTCSSPSDCPNATDTCVSGVCVAGGTQPGGLGSTCTANSECDSGQCASDGSHMYCVVPCDPTHDACPANFSCIETTAANAGVCFPGANSGGGACGGCSNTGSSSGGFLLFGLTFVSLAFGRRRR